MEHELILKMIEDVDPKDQSKLDEIDCRFFAWYKGQPYHSYGQSDLIWGDVYGHKKGAHLFTEDPTVQPNGYAHCPPVTRSRDALKSLRSNGWMIGISQQDNGDFISGWDFYIYPDDFKNIKSPVLQTEELAELHCLIQVIAYERSLK